MKKLIALVLCGLSVSALAETKPTLSQKLAVISFPNSKMYEVGSVEEKRSARALANVEGICKNQSLEQLVNVSVVAQEMAVKAGHYITPVEVLEALGTLKRQATDDVDCGYIVSHYLGVLDTTPTPAEALASVNSLYKVLKQMTQTPK